MDEIPIQYAAGARRSQLPIQRAAAVAIRDPDGMVLLARRNPDFVGEFPGVWSLPSKFVPDGANARELLRASILEWFGLTLEDLVLVTRRTALRRDWRLQMDLYESRLPVSEEVASRSRKYDDVGWFDGVEFFSRVPSHQLGDCARSFLDHERGREL